MMPRGGIQSLTAFRIAIDPPRMALIHAGDFGRRCIILHPAAMCETGATNQAAKRENLDDVGYVSGVRAGARQRVVCSKPRKYLAAPQEVISCHQSTIRRERLVAPA
jgi:hypothetical protein